MEAIFGVIIEPLLALIGYLLLALLVYVIGLPLLCVVCTPVVLVMAGFGSGTYGDKVVSGYKAVWRAASLNRAFISL